MFDHLTKTAYACRSNRTDIKLLELVCDKLNYTYIDFDSADQNGFPIYHTNVMMWIGTDVAAICIESIKNVEVKNVVPSLLTELIKILNILIIT